MPTTQKPLMTRFDQVSEATSWSDPNGWFFSANSHTDQNYGTSGNWYETRITNKDPLYRDKLKKGVDCSLYYKRTGIELTWRPLIGAAETIVPGTFPYNTRGYYSHALVQNMPARSPTDSTTRDQALARVKRRIASLEESFQSLIPLAELRESRELIHQLMNQTTDVIKAIADLKRTKGKSLFRYVQDHWLQYSFGVAPMMRDLQDLGNSMWAYLTKGDVRDRVQGTAGKDWQSVGPSDTAITGLLGAPIRSDSEASHVLSYRYVAGWKFLIRSSNDYGALQHFGVTPPALIPALWETTAYSWVVDYFTTVGDWLEDVFVGSAGSSMYVVEDRKYSYTAQLTQVYQFNKAQVRVVKHRPGHVWLNYWEFERTPLGALPSRTLRWKTVDEIGNHALTKLLNLASLTFRGRRWKDI